MNKLEREIDKNKKIDQILEELAEMKQLIQAVLIKLDESKKGKK